MLRKLFPCNWINSNRAATLVDPDRRCSLDEFSVGRLKRFSNRLKPDGARHSANLFAAFRRFEIIPSIPQTIVTLKRRERKLSSLPLCFPKFRIINFPSSEIDFSRSVIQLTAKQINVEEKMSTGGRKLSLGKLSLREVADLCALSRLH